MLSASFLAATAVISVASALQAATGMGMALFAAPLLALLDTRFVPVPTLTAVMFLSAVVAWRGREDIDRDILPPALLGLLVGCGVGAALLVAFAGLRLERVFAVLILAAVGVSLSGIRVRVGRLALLLGGAASGVLGTMSGAHGPPIALVLQHEPPERLRVTLCRVFRGGVCGVFGDAGSWGAGGLGWGCGGAWAIAGGCGWAGARAGVGAED